MSIRIADGQFIVTKPSGGGTLFNIDDKLLHITDTNISGSKSIGSISGGAASSGGPGPVKGTDYYDLGAVNPFATQLIGAVKFVLTGPGDGLAYNRWHTVMGGSVVWVMDGPGLTSRGRTSNGGPLCMVTYHFEIASNRARMVRNWAISSGYLYVVQPHVIEYKLRAGAWV